MKSIISRSVVWLVVVLICLCMPSYAVQGLTVTDDLGDFCFFKSDYITHRYTAYPNLSATLKGNVIGYEKFDYKNPDKGDRIIFNKTVTNTATANDMFIDITAKIFSTYQSSRVYRISRGFPIAD